MTKFKKLIIFSLILVMSFVFFGRICTANETPAAKAWPEIKKIVDVGTAVGVSIAFLVILIGAVCYILSLGGIEAIATTKLLGTGKDQIKAGFTALLILATFYTLMSIMNPGWTSFSKLTGITIGEDEPKEGKKIEPPPIPTQKYQEIPLGTIVENVLAKGIYCFEFDNQGDIIDSDPSPEFDPLINHDRLDCTKKIVEAIKIKSHKLIRLVIAYQELLEECKCNGTWIDEKTGKEHYYCECICDGKPCLEQFCICEGSLKYTGNLSYNPQKEKQPADPDTPSEEMVEKNCKLNCPCPKEPKNPKESGKGICRTNKAKNYYGLCPPATLEKMKDFWEKKLEKENPTIVSNFLNYDRDYFKCLEEKKSAKDCSNKGKKVVDEYEKLKIRDKLGYLKIKLEEVINDLEKDKKSLESATKIIEEDYLVEPYVEFVKIAEEVSKTEGKIEIEKFEIDGKKVLSDRYCKGFNYLGLHKKCFGDKSLKGFLKELWNDLFKILIPKDREEKEEEYLFKTHLNACAGSCTSYCRENAKLPSGKISAKKYFECIEKTLLCECACSNDINGKIDTQCEIDCENCEKDCNTKFSWCKPEGENKEYPKCKEQRSSCNGVCDDKKIGCYKECEELFKGDKTAIDYCKEGWKKHWWNKRKYGCEQEYVLCQNFCEEQEKDCVSDCYNTYLFPCYTKCYGQGCQFCSDQHAGYKECSIKSYSWWEKLLKENWWDNLITGITKITTPVCSKNEYSSYDFFDWWKGRGCIVNPLCFRGKGYGEIYSYAGIEDYHQAFKCPTCSDCPECPCLTCSGQCGEYAYDTDPLTFYSKKGETEEIYPGPLKNEKYDCDRIEDIPVGRLVDGIIKPSGNKPGFIEMLTSLLEKTKKTIEVEFKIIDTLKPENFQCEGRKFFSEKDLFEEFMNTSVEKITPELLDKLIGASLDKDSSARCETDCYCKFGKGRWECTGGHWEEVETDEKGNPIYQWVCTENTFQGWPCACDFKQCKGDLKIEKEIKALEKIVDILDYFSRGTNFRQRNNCRKKVRAFEDAYLFKKENERMRRALCWI